LGLNVSEGDITNGDKLSFPNNTSNIGNASKAVTIIVTPYYGNCVGTPEEFTITVNPKPDAGTISGATEVCKGSTITLINSTPGVWKSSNNDIATVTGGTVTGVAEGNVNIWRVATAQGCSDSVSYEITVNPTPPQLEAIIGETDVCRNHTITLTNSTPGGVWKNNNPALVTVTDDGVVTVNATGNYAIISYVVTNAQGCSASVSHKVNAWPVPHTDKIFGESEVCVGSEIMLSSFTTGGVGAVWRSEDTSIATVVQNGDYGTVTGESVGVVKIWYIAGGGGD
jgi:hypothetical protein